MFKNIKRLVPETKTTKLQLLVLLIVLLFVMPNVTAWSANYLEGFNKLSIFIWLIVLQIVWALIWYTTYWGLKKYILNVILVRNLQMGLYFLSGAFIVLSLLDNNSIFSLVITAVSYLSMIIWYNYVFNNLEDSDKTSSKLHQFWTNHRKVNKKDVQKLINDGNEEMKNWFRDFQAEKDNAGRVVVFYPDGTKRYK